MKILHVITTVELGGAEKQLLTLCAEQRLLGKTVNVIFLKGKPRLASDFADIGVDVFDFSTEPFLKQIFSLRQFVDACRPNVVHGHLPRAELLCMLSRPKGGFCVSRHNAEKFWPDAPNLISRALSRLVVHESEACISISKAVLEFGLKSGELPNSDKVKLIHYGIKSNGTIIARKHGRQNLNLLCIARLEKQKDLQTLLYSIQVAKSKSPNVHLHILGEGSLRQDLQLLCEHLEIMPFVTFHGTVKNVDYFYDLADLFILPSLYEGFGLVYLEALANGLPVVTSRNSAALEIFGVDYIGLFDIGDYRELARLIVKMSNKNIQKKLLPEYRMILQRFNSQTMAKEINKVYELTF